MLNFKYARSWDIFTPGRTITSASQLSRLPVKLVVPIRIENRGPFHYVNRCSVMTCMIFKINATTPDDFGLHYTFTDLIEYDNITSFMVEQ